MRRLVLLLVAAFFLAGCSGGTDSGGAPSGEAAPAPGSPEGGSSDGSGGVLPSERSLVRSAELTVSVPDVEAARQEAFRLVEEADGRVEQESSSGSEDLPEEVSVYLTFRVPPDELDPLVEDLSELGRLVSRTSSSVDVTEEVVDVESRIQTLESSIARLRALLATAEDVGELVAVEGELTERESELESLQARSRALDEQVDSSSLTLTLYPQGSPLEERETGFFAGLQEGWEAFKSAMVGGATVLGALFPFLALAGVVTLFVLGVLRLSRRRRSEGPAPRRGRAQGSAPAPSPPSTSPSSE